MPDLAGVALVFVVLAAHNVLSNRVVPWAWYVPTNLATAAVLLGIAVAGGAASRLGVSPADLPRGILIGTASAAIVSLAITAAAVIPASRRAFADRRMAGVNASGTFYRAFIRIPLGTVALEEVAFRGVLLALLLPITSPWPAVIISSAVFGAWHILPTAAALNTNRAASSGGRKAILAAVGLTFAVGMALCWLRLATGSLVAPALVHAAANSTATVASFLVLRRRRREGQTCAGVAE